MYVYPYRPILPPHPKSKTVSRVMFFSQHIMVWFKKKLLLEVTFSYAPTSSAVNFSLCMRSTEEHGAGEGEI